MDIFMAIPLYVICILLWAIIISATTFMFFITGYILSMLPPPLMEHKYSASIGIAFSVLGWWAIVAVTYFNKQ